MKNTNLTAKIEIKGLDRAKDLLEELNSLELKVVVHSVDQDKGKDR
ncbi:MULTISPECIES: hypothetical protein [Bacillus]|nr:MULTISPECIES: hypothetical protein [Bacillus]